MDECLSCPVHQVSSVKAPQSKETACNCPEWVQKSTKRKHDQFLSQNCQWCKPCCDAPAFATRRMFGCCAWMKHPHQCSRLVPASSLKANLPFAHTAKPDVANLIKFVLDAMNKIVYEDDKQVVKLTACKLCDSEGKCEGRTVVEVMKFHSFSC